MVALSDRIFMTAAEYLDWEPTQEERYEYWDGEVVAMSGAIRNHNRVSLNVSKLLDDAQGNRTRFATKARDYIVTMFKALRTSSR
jgi:Uma2 family endonuclease